jgi:CRP-like cAMP-binding protein
LTCINIASGSERNIGAMQQTEQTMQASGGSASGGNGSRPGSRDPQLIAQVLANLPLFRQVSRQRIATVAGHSRVQSVRRSTVMVRRGDALPGMIVFAYGSAKLSLRHHDGEEKVVRFLGAGEAFGEAAALHDRPSPVELATLADSMVVVVPPLPLLALVEMDPRFARNLVRLLSDKFLGLLGELESSLQQSALQRLAAYLGSLAQPNGRPGAWVARLPASKTAIAARIGITKETMSRLLRELANRNLIVVAQREIEIRDLAGLSRLSR